MIGEDIINIEKYKSESSLFGNFFKRVIQSILAEEYLEIIIKAKKKRNK